MPDERSTTPPSRAPTVAFGCALGALIAGVATSCAVGALSVSAGMFSLAFGQMAARPFALAFVALHLVTLAIALVTRARTPATERGALSIAAIALSALGLAASAALAIWAPGAYQALLGAAADGASRVH